MVKAHGFYLPLLILLVLTVVITLLYSLGLSPTNNQDSQNIQADPVCKDCNIIFITIDTLRADHIGSHGYYRNTTPNIDEFFSDKSIFLNAYSTAPCTVPSVMQMITGSFKYEKEAPRLAEILRDNGFNTAAVISQHTFGFMEDPKPRYARGFDFYDIQSKNQVDHHDQTTRTASEISDKALELIDKIRDNGNFFLWLYYFDPHDPYNPPVESRFFSSDNISDPTGDVRMLLYDAEGRYNTDWKQTGFIFDEKQVSDYKDLYDGEIHYTDQQVGRVLDRLKELGLVNNSIIILLSDHGERLGEDDRWIHCTSIHDTEIHVPLMMSVKGLEIDGEKIIDTPVSTIDVFPTILALTGIRYNRSAYDGNSLVDMNGDRTAFTVWEGEKALHKKGWKLYYDKGPTGVHRITSKGEDPVNQIETMINVKDELVKDMTIFNEKVGDLVSEKTREIIKQLEEIGYL